MTSGIECGLTREETELVEITRSPDWIRFALNLETIETPGLNFAYRSPGAHLLAGRVHATSGIRPLEFARRNLFEPMGIRGARWTPPGAAGRRSPSSRRKTSSSAGKCARSPIRPLPAIAGRISGRTYRLDANAMELESIRLTFQACLRLINLEI